MKLKVQVYLLDLSVRTPAAPPRPAIPSNGDNPDVPNYAILRVTKLKGGSVAASDQHTERSRETPNADPERRRLNELLLGEDRELREMVAERVREEGLWRRKDSVEVVEVLLTATRAHFLDDEGGLDGARVRRWEERNVAWLKEKYGGLVLKAKSHLDERTPHITAYVLPVIEGRLNAKDFVGGREDLERLQDEYAAAMKGLGLRRGVRGSRARHQDIGRFYGAILEPVTLEVDRGQIRPPSGWEMATRKGREAYRDEVIAEVLSQVLSQVETIKNQALLTLEETRKREDSERRAAERVGRAEEIARQAHGAFLGERAEREALGRENLDLKRDLFLAREEAAGLGGRLEGLDSRLRDVPLTEVMTRLDYHGERRGDAVVYRTRDGRASMTVTDSEARNYEGRVICRNSVDLVLFMENVNKGGDVSLDEALSWLAENFGEGRAAAAYVARSEQSAAGFLEERRLERERQAPGRAPAWGHEDPDRGAPAHEPPGSGFDR